MQSAYLRRFIFLVALPLFVASACVAWLTSGLIIQVSSGANESDHARTNEVVRSAVRAIQTQLANTVSDNSWWDDAVRNLYGNPNPDWVRDSYGASSEQGINYDAFLVVDRTLTEAAIGMSRGNTFTPDLAAYFNDKLDGLLDLLPQTWGRHQAAASLFNTPDGLAVAAAAPIIPTSEHFPLPAAHPRYMVLLRFLSADAVAQLGRQYVIRDLSILTSMPARFEDALLYDYAGNVVARATWQDRQPGNGARLLATQRASFVLSLLGIVLLGVGTYCFRLIRASVMSEAMSRHKSLHDPLTGLPNRTALQARLEEGVSRKGHEIALAFADLDGFKEVNDTFDHETGDRLIRTLAIGLRVLVGERGTLYRLGGDEFVVLVEASRAETAAAHIAEEVIQYLDRSFDLEGRMAKVGASIGIATSRPGEVRGPELMRRADIAMYRAKTSGKNRYCLYDPQLDCDRIEDIAIAHELRGILDRGEIEIAYQPIIRAETGNVAAVEAVARWPSSSLRRIAPDRFIAVAEQHGLIDDLGASILQKACADATSWPAVRLSVNVSPVQLLNPNFVCRTLQTISEAGLAFSRVEIEITEGILVSDMADARRIFEELRATGIHIALDDFGTGFSSIGYLKRFAFDRIKIDRSLVEQILKGGHHQQLVQGVLMMARGLSASVTAEGVENAGQAAALLDSGCDELQGYYYFRPMPAAEITQLHMAASSTALARPA